MKLETRAVHAGDRKRTGTFIPVTTPIYTAATYFYDDATTLDRALGEEIAGPSYIRHGAPNVAALEELMVSIEGGGSSEKWGAQACSSGMAALHLAILTALLDRRRVVLAASALYGATTNMLTKVLEPAGTEVFFADFCDETALAAAIAEHKPSALVMETISNPLLRVAPLDHIAKMAKDAGASLVVDSTFSTPLVTRPCEWGATFTVHSLTKFLSGHGDVMGGIVITDEANITQLRALARSIGPVMGPFEAYLAMRGIKTFPLRMERHCSNASHVASWLASHPAVERVYFPGDPAHPDAENIKRTFAPGVYGALVAFEVRGAGREEIFRLMNAFRVVVPATSLGDVHTLAAYPASASHRDLSPKHRARLGINDNLLRLSIGIENVEDIVADIDQALASLK